METWLNYKPLTLLLGRKDILAYCLFESMLLTSSSVFGVMLDFGGRPRAFFTIPELMILTTPDPRFYTSVTSKLFGSDKVCLSGLKFVRPNVLMH